MNHAECSVTKCKLLQRALARKYDVNLTWHIAEIEPDVWCLYSPDGREPIFIGELEETIAAYRSRGPVVLHRSAPKPKPKAFANIKFDI